MINKKNWSPYSWLPEENNSIQNWCKLRSYPFKGVNLEILISTTIEILDIQTREKFKKHRWDFPYLQKNYFSFQFHVNLEYYILGSQIRVNFIDSNCYCHWFKTTIVGKQVVLYPLRPLPHYSRLRHATEYIMKSVLIQSKVAWALFKSNSNIS